MGFFEGFRAAVTGQENIELFEKTYLEFAGGQPANVRISFFHGYRAIDEIPAGKMKEFNDGYMFHKFSGEELPSRHKLNLIARAIWKIENQPEAHKRQKGSVLLMKYFKWDEAQEKEMQLLEALNLKALCRTHKQFAEQISEMGIELMSDREERDWLLKTFTGIDRAELMDWLSIGQENLIVRFMDIKAEDITMEDFERYEDKSLYASMEEFRKAVAQTQLKLAFMAF